MTATRRRQLTGLLYVAPAIVFVLVFTAYPVIQMVSISFTNWSLIAPPKNVGLGNYTTAFGDAQFWVSLGYTLKYTILITPILMVGGYLLALLVAPNSPLRRTTRALIFIPVVIGLGVSSLMWVWLFDPTFGLINKALSDLGLIEQPVLWLGVGRGPLDLGDHRVGHLEGGRLRDAPVRRRDPGHPERDQRGDDGRRGELLAADPEVTVPLTRRTILLVTLVSVIGSLLAFDQFYIMTAGQPFNQTATAVFYIYLNSFHVPAPRLWRRAVRDPGGDHPRVHHRPDGPDPAVGGMTAVTLRTPVGARSGRASGTGRTATSSVRICLAVCAFMVAPIVLSVLASVKTTGEAAAVPPTYVPHELALDSYRRLWSYQAGLPTYLGNSFATAFMTIGFTLALTIPAGYALARFPVPGKELIFVFLLLALIVPYQALLTPIFLMFAQLKLTNTLVGLAILHTTIQLPFSLYIMRNSFESVPTELEEAAVTDGGNSWQILRSIFIPAVVPAIVTVTLFAFVTSWNEFLGALVLLSRASTFTLPLILASARAETSLGGTDWGMLQAGVTIAMIPCIGIYLLLQKYYVAGFTSGAIK